MTETAVVPYKPNHTVAISNDVVQVLNGTMLNCLGTNPNPMHVALVQSVCFIGQEVLLTRRVAEEALVKSEQVSEQVSVVDAKVSVLGEQMTALSDHIKAAPPPLPTSPLRTLIETTLWAYPTLCFLRDWDEWRASVKLQAGVSHPDGAYGKVFHDDGQTVVFVAQLFTQAVYTRFTGCRLATLGEIEQLCRNIHTLLNTDTRVRIFDIPLQRRTHTHIFYIPSKLWRDALALTRDYADNKQVAGLWPPMPSKKHGSTERRTANDPLSADGKTHNSKFIFTHAPWVNPKTMTAERWRDFCKLRLDFVTRKNGGKPLGKGVDIVEHLRRAKTRDDAAIDEANKARARAGMQASRKRRASGKPTPPPPKKRVVAKRAAYINDDDDSDYEESESSSSEEEELLERGTVVATSEPSLDGFGFQPNFNYDAYPVPHAVAVSTASLLNDEDAAKLERMLNGDTF